MKTPSKKLIILPMAALAIVGAALYSTSQASADTASSDPRATLIQKLADTLHVDKSKVQAVFDQDQAEHQKTREADYDTRLTQAVTDGKLTSAQKEAILAEHKTLAAKLETAKGKTTAERKTIMKDVWQEAKAWASKNNLEARWLIGMGPQGHGIGHGGPGIRGGHLAPDTTDTPSAKQAN